MTESSAVKFEGHFKDWVQTLIQEKKTTLQMTAEQIDENYSLAYSLYRNQQYREADIFFRLLVSASPMDPKFWKGLGACLQMRKSYEEALNCYSSAQILNQNTPDPFLDVYSADCYFALKQIDAAFKALDAAYSNAEKTNQSRIIQHVNLMREIWSK